MTTEAGINYFSQERRWQSWLVVEAALARVQAEAGIIPDWAARAIADAAQLEKLDLPALKADVRKTMAPVYALSRALAAASGEAGPWVHWGATTQNIIDAGRLLVLKDVQRDLKARLAGVLKHLSDLAETHAETVMVGRTNRQHALPITFGFRVASWIDEVLRVCEQLDSAEQRLFELRFGGAIGTFQSLGEAGPKISEALAKELGLRPARYEGRAQVDVLIEYVSRLGMLGVAATRVSGELYESMQTELCEIQEGLGHEVVGSSTMPHKLNPKLVVEVKANANRLRSMGAQAYTVTPPSFEGDAVSNRELRGLTEEAVRLSLSVTAGLESVLSAILINEEEMAKTLKSSSAETSLEAIMMQLAPEIGRDAAHDVLRAAATKARETGISLQELVQTLPEVTQVLSPATLKRLFDPAQNTGQSASVALRLAAAARDCAARLKKD